MPESTYRYPLGEHEDVASRTGRRVREITLDAVRAGQVAPEDLTIHADTLRAQAAVAEREGWPQLAANLRRAAELASVPQDMVLTVYEALRPYRVTHERLLALADELEHDYGAVENARFLREAAAVYRERKLL